ncbi:M16 family metallopeptidase [Patescibacteria group bacterium]
MFKLQTLQNGLRLITLPMKGTRAVTALVMIGTGSKYETRKNSGISHFLEHMFFKGTEKRPSAMAIASTLDGIGAEYNAFTGKEYTGYWVKAEAGKIKLAMDVVSDMLLNIKLEQEEIEREKGVIVEELNMYQDNPIMHIEDVFETCLYGDTPAGWDTIGTRETIMSFGRQDFTQYFQSQYAPHNTIVSLVGNIDHAQAKRLAEKYFSTPKFIERGRDFQEKKKVREKQARPQIKLHYKKTDQAHLSLGVRTVGYDHKEKLIIKLLSIILGGSMSSRMFINLRERNGLAYYVRTGTESYTDCGYLTTRAGVPVAKLPQALKIILSEYRKIKNNLVGPEELKRNKDLLKGRVTLQLEASDNQADWYGRQATLLDTIKRTKRNKKALNLLTPEKYFKLIEGISSKDIQRVARKVFVNKGLNLAIIGPFRGDKSLKKIIKL